ncbi:MAG: transporter [Pseudomonadota bacterium]
MKKIIFAAVALVAALSASAGGGHYVPGVEGMQAASVPPPGTYYLGYLVDYNIEKLKAPGSSTDIPGNNTGTVVALANRLVWISNTKFLGADFGMETIIPMVSTSLTFNTPGISETQSGIGDVYLGPVVLGWHGASWDAVAAAGVWVDSGASQGAAAPGNGYKSTMLTAGATYYFDSAKTFSASALMRFESNSEKAGGFKPGNQTTLEWGIGKMLQTVQVGVVGYDQVQTTDDSGPGATTDRSSRHAIGAEVVYPIMSAGVFLKAAAYREYRSDAGSGPETQGNLLRFTLVKAF